MQVLNFPSRKLNKKKIIIFISICFILFLILITSIIYSLNSSFRKFIDIYIFRKEIKSDALFSVEITSNEDQYYYAYDKYIAVLNKKILYLYTNYGEIAEKNDINVSSPIFSSNNKFLAIAENNGSNIFLLSGTKIMWQGTVDGNISKIDVNKNGYISVIVSGTNYKSIIIYYRICRIRFGFFNRNIFYHWIYYCTRIINFGNR